MTRTLSLAVALAAAANLWLITTAPQAATWAGLAVATERGAMPTQVMGRREARCPKGEVYDRAKKECVPRAKRETKKETKKETDKEPK
jgi:hypothetical protein